MEKRQLLFMNRLYINEKCYDDRYNSLSSSLYFSIFLFSRMTDCRLADETLSVFLYSLDITFYAFHLYIEININNAMGVIILYTY